MSCLHCSFLYYKLKPAVKPLKEAPHITGFNLSFGLSSPYQFFCESVVYIYTQLSCMYNLGIILSCSNQVRNSWRCAVIFEILQ